MTFSIYTFHQILKRTDIVFSFPNTRHFQLSLSRYWKILVSGQSELNELCVEEPHEFSVGGSLVLLPLLTLSPTL